MNTYLSTTPEQITAFVALPINGPIQMLNLLKFKDHVPETGLSGEEQYQAYMQEVAPFVQQAGGKIIYSGKSLLSLIGPAGTEEWDKILILEYPNKQAFITMSMDKSFPTTARTLALADSRLVFCSATS